jgi:hypothetical protein
MDLNIDLINASASKSVAVHRLATTNGEPTERYDTGVHNGA